MIFSKAKFIVWLAITLLLGIASGYLFSSKFCSVSIGKRVEKISTLNQNIRKLLYDNNIFTYQYLKSKFFNLPDANEFAQKLKQNNTDISAIFKTYYGSKAAKDIEDILQRKNEIYEQMDDFNQIKIVQDKLSKLSTSLIDYLKKLNPNWNNSTDFADSFITKLGLGFNKLLNDWNNNHWKSATDQFAINLNFSLQSADELDRAITQQFRHKF